jgi:hypothetical protein
MKYLSFSHLFTALFTSFTVSFYDKYSPGIFNVHLYYVQSVSEKNPSTAATPETNEEDDPEMDLKTVMLRVQKGMELTQEGVLWWCSSFWLCCRRFKFEIIS